MTQEQNKPGESACCGADCCCGPAVVESGKRQVVIDFLYLDLEVCTWCKGTGDSLEGALAQVENVLQAGGVAVVVNRIHVDSEDKAMRHRFASSPTIRVNGRDIQMEGKESKCESCGDLCGDDVNCRIWLYQGKEYTSPPPAMIVDAILREVYGQPVAAAESGEPFVLPDNLRKFFRAMQNKK